MLVLRRQTHQQRLMQGCGQVTTAAAAVRLVVRHLCCLHSWTPACCQTGTKPLRCSGKATGRDRCASQGGGPRLPHHDRMHSNR